MTHRRLLEWTYDTCRRFPHQGATSRILLGALAELPADARAFTGGNIPARSTDTSPPVYVVLPTADTRSANDLGIGRMLPEREWRNEVQRAHRLAEREVRAVSIAAGAPLAGERPGAVLFDTAAVAVVAHIGMLEADRADQAALKVAELTLTNSALQEQLAAKRGALYREAAQVAWVAVRAESEAALGAAFDDMRAAWMERRGGTRGQRRAALRRAMQRARKTWQAATDDIAAPPTEAP